jgi:hypothetical protein
MSPQAVAVTRSSLRPALLVTDCSRQWTIEGGRYRRRRDMVTSRKQTMNDTSLQELLKFVKSTNTFPNVGAGNAARRRPLSVKAHRFKDASFSTSRHHDSHYQRRNIKEPIADPTLY